jgi:hypothetical protein
MENKIIKLASKVGDISELTKKLIEDGDLETVHPQPEEEVELTLLILADKGKVSIDDISGLKFANRPKSERLQIFKEIKSYMQYIGFGGEHAVISQLMFRGVNATKSFIDEGYDIIATGKKKMFFVQVKTSFLNEKNNYLFNIDIKKESVNFKGKYTPVYIFVMTKGGQDSSFIIFTQDYIAKQIELKNIWHIKGADNYRMKIYFRDKKFYLGKMENDVSDFVDNWSVFDKSHTTNTNPHNLLG